MGPNAGGRGGGLGGLSTKQISLEEYGSPFSSSMWISNTVRGGGGQVLYTAVFPWQPTDKKRSGEIL
jgi:hypothetical protein